MHNYLVTGKLSVGNKNSRSKGKTCIEIEHAIGALDENDAVRQVTQNVISALNAGDRSGFTIPGFGCTFVHDFKAVML
jgi:hypothetical protein